MDFHHKFVGFSFAYLGTNLLASMSEDVFHQRFASDGRKLHKSYVCSVLAIILGLIQLITSAYLTVNEKFLKIWSFIHIGLALGYMIMFLILIDDTIGEDNIFQDWFSHSFLTIIPVAVFNLIFKKMTQTPANGGAFVNPPNIPFYQFGGPAEAQTVNFNPMPNAAEITTSSYQPYPYPTSYPATSIPLNENVRPADNPEQP